MIWTDGVIATVALKEWGKPENATIAVAVSLAATDGDDSYWYKPTTPGLAELRGAWAIPWLPEMESLDLDPFTLRDNAKLARIMTGPNGDEWDWSIIYRSKSYLDKMDRAREAIKHPEMGMMQRSPIPSERFMGAPQAIAATGRAVQRVLNQTGRAFRQPPTFNG